MEKPNLEIDDFIPKKNFEHILFQIIRANMHIFEDYNVINILVNNGNAPIFDIQGITINSDEMFVNTFNATEPNQLDIAVKKVSDLYKTYAHKNCVLVVLSNNRDFLVFTYQFNDIQMAGFSYQE
jgi:hypothetical protein